MATWAPPTPLTFSVAGGVVVSARVRLQSGQPAIGPDATGIIPHFEIFPTIAPVGTGAMHAFDPQSGEVGPEFFETPIASEDGQIPGDDPYWVDLGKAWRAPWPCTVKITGGAVDGATSALDVSIRRTRCEEVFERRPVIDLLGPCELFTGRKGGPSELQRLAACTISFRDVPAGTPIQIPRGAWAVEVLTTTTIAFTWLGTVTSLAIPGGAIIPIGVISQGTFEATEAPIPWISFYVEIA